MERVDSGPAKWREVECLCHPCADYLSTCGKPRPKELEPIRQLTIAVKAAEGSGTVYDCSNCGLACDGANKGRMRQISKADGKIRCHNCNTWYWKKGQVSERPWHCWDGAEAFAALYDAEFRQWNQGQVRDDKTCACGNKLPNRKRRLGTLQCRICRVRDVSQWPAFQQWIDAILKPRTLAAGKTIRALFVEVRGLQIYKDTEVKTRLGGRRENVGRKKLTAVNNDDTDNIDNQDDSSLSAIPAFKAAALDSEQDNSPASLLAQPIPLNPLGRRRKTA